MDFGDDPLVSTHYMSIHSRASQALHPQRLGRLEALKHRTQWSKESIDYLRDHNVTPEMCVAAGMTWKAMAKQHGVDSLIAFGFRWPAMIAAGFSGSDLQSLSKHQMARLKINAARALECKPSIANIARLGLSAEELSNAGYTADMLQTLGLRMENMVDFGIPLQSWMRVFSFKSLADLGFSSYSQCANAGWSDAEIKLALKPAALPKPVQKAAAAAGMPANFTFQL